MKTTEQLNTLTNVNLLDKQKSSNDTEHTPVESTPFTTEYTPVENTPFTIVKQNGLYYGLLSNHKLTESYLDEEICKKELTAITWDRIVQVIWTVAEKMSKINELKDKENE